MRYILVTILPIILIFYSYTSSHYYKKPQATVIAQIPDWIENVALRSNGDLLLSTIGAAKVYSVNPNITPSKPEIVTQIHGVNSLFGITQIADDVFAVAGGNFTDFVLYNNTMNLSVLDFKAGDAPAVRTVFETSGYGPINGMTSLPHAKHIILGADSMRGEILRIDTSTGVIQVASKDKELAPSTGAPFPTGVNGLKVLGNYLYFTSTGYQSLNRVKIDKIGNRIVDYEVIYKFKAGLAPVDFVIDSHGNAYVACWMDKVAKVTSNGRMTILSEGLLAGPTAFALSHDEKDLYAVSAGFGDNISGGQVIRINLP
ncbi:hypothetical protein NW768_006823 [Fusarium equiseti]|uniref:SMP-30/Gluconolactonase/LRE-like region domain-containing protein n=1 Tax=Fusarium equiseti TaxID=61235 RepID=A0ABQ8R9A6_FUSEQ|nr:hypothetical protein NW768_006823 [Fusarium equiseti]